jgi:hypothetical protein
MIIDYIDNLETENIDNLHALSYMKEWLNALANNMKQYEEQTKSDPLMNWCIFAMWTPTWISDNLLICLYMWFSNTLVNYIQLVWTLSIMKKKWWVLSDIHNNKAEIKKFSKEYTESIIPEVITWRNKVFAHFSFTDPRQDDNLWLLQHSVTNPVSWNWNNYIIWWMQWWIWSERTNLPQWSLTEKYKEIIPRYWPETIDNT